MSNFFIWKNERYNPKFDAHFNCILLDKSNFPVPNPFNKGISVTNEGLMLKVMDDRSEIGQIRDVLSLKIQNNENLLVISEPTKRILEKFEDNLEFYPANFANRTIDGYFIVNVLQSAPAINLLQSKVIYWDEKREIVFNIDQLVLKEDSIEERLNVFLLERVRGAILVFSLRILKAFEREKILGLMVVEPENFKF